MKSFDALAGKSLSKTQLLGCVWFTLWLHHYPPIGITSEYDRKYSSVSQDLAFFGPESVSTSDSSVNREWAWNCLQVHWSPSACLALNWYITSVDAVPQWLFFQRPCSLSACDVALRLLQAFVPGGQCQLGSGKYSLSNQIFNDKLGSGCPVLPNLFSFFSDCSDSSEQCSWKPAYVHLGRRTVLKSMQDAFWDREGFWGSEGN